MFAYCLNVFLKTIETIPRKQSTRRVIFITSLIKMNPISFKKIENDKENLTVYTKKQSKQFQYLKCMHNRRCWKTIPTKATTKHLNNILTSKNTLNSIITKTTQLTSITTISTPSILENCLTKTPSTNITTKTPTTKTTTTKTTTKTTTTKTTTKTTTTKTTTTKTTTTKSTTTKTTSASLNKFNFSELFPNFDPNVNMSYFNPLKLSSNQTGLLQNLKKGICWKKSYMRGVGSPITYCDPETDKEGALCYPKCKPGYTGVGPACWKQCKPGYTERGAFCIIDLDIYIKGCCCAIDDECCNNCNVTYIDDGCTCRRPPKSYPRKYYSRGLGSPLGCKPDEERNGLLCYPKCNSSYTGEGPVCWQNCKTSFPIECGAACAVNSGNCFNSLVNFGLAFGTPLGSIFAFQNILNLLSLIDLSAIPFEFLAIQCYS